MSRTTDMTFLPHPQVTSKGKERLDTLLKKEIDRSVVPCIFFAATNAEETIYENQAGYNVMGDSSSGTVNRDSTMEIYSMTKLIVSVAILRLVEQHVLRLDDQGIIEEHLPELANQQVLEGYNDAGKAILVPRTTSLTVRKLLDHTSGCTTPQRHPRLAQWYKAHPNPAPRGLMSDASVESIIAPLLFQPGTSWMYSSGTDWLGVLINRITGLSLEEYFQKEIFSLVEGGMPDTTFYPRTDIVKRKVAIYKRETDGTLTKYPGFSENRPDTVEKISKKFLAGSGGLFGTMKDFLALLRTILRCDPRYAHPPEEPLLSPESFKLLFEPSVEAGVPAQKAAELFAGLNCWAPEPTAENSNHSVGLALTLVDSDHGRKKGSGGWYGMARTQYWLDPTTGIAAICATQIVGPEPDPWSEIYTKFERTLYDGLK